MNFLANVLPVEPDRYIKTNASMTKDLLHLDANGNVSIQLTHEDVQYTPKAFKVEIKYSGDFSEFDPATFVKVLVKDNSGKYQVATAPLSQSNIYTSKVMSAIVPMSVADFTDLIFSVYTEEAIDITEWKMYPSVDIDSSALNQIESMLPQFLFYFNEAAITVGSMETQVANIPINMGEAGNLTGHFLMIFEATKPCLVSVSIKLDSSIEPYCPIVYPVVTGQNYIGIPHSFLQVQVAPHLATVDIKLLPASTEPISYNGVLTSSLGSAASGTAFGMTLANDVNEQATLKIPAKGIRYTLEGRGILNGAGGEYPHAEVSATYTWPTFISQDRFYAIGAATASIAEPTSVPMIDTYIYADVDTVGFDIKSGLSSTHSGKVSIVQYNSAYADTLSLSGDAELTSTGIDCTGPAEIIVACSLSLPFNEDDSYCFVIAGFNIPIPAGAFMSLALSKDNGASWHTLNRYDEWVECNLVSTDMAASSLNSLTLPRISEDTWATFIGYSTDIQLAIYVRSITASTVLTRAEMYYRDTTLPPTSLPTPESFMCIPDANCIRTFWTIPIGADYFVRLMYGTDPNNLDRFVDTSRFVSTATISNLDNNTKYYVAASGFIGTVFSDSTETIEATPALKAPTILSATGSIYSIILSWYIIGIVYDSYNIYVGTSPDMLTKVLSVPGTSFTCTIGNLLTDTAYVVAIKGCLNNEESAFSNYIECSTDSTLILSSYGKEGSQPPTTEDAQQYGAVVEITNGIQKFIVDKTGSYLITALGAAGGKGSGTANCLGGYGAKLTGTFSLLKDDELYVCVGQKGTDNSQTSGDGTTGAGGGMTVVAVRDNSSAELLFGTIPVRALLVAGGGNGGGDAAYSGKDGSNALLDDATTDDYLISDRAGAGYAAYHNNANTGKSFLGGCAAATNNYTRGSGTSYAGFGGAGSNTDDGQGGGGAGYRGGTPGGKAGSSFNADTTGMAELGTERTSGKVTIKMIGGQ